MKALFVTPPGFGHLHPLVGLASALRSSGHEVSFVSSRSFAPRIEKAGFEALSIEPDWLEAEPEKSLSWLGDAPTAGDEPFRFLTEIFFEVARLMVPELRELCEQRGIDLLVRTDYDFSSPIVAELLDLPHVTVGTDFLMPMYVWRAVAGPSLAFLRHQFGLSQKSDYFLIYRDLLLSVLPAAYDMKTAPVRTERLRQSYFDRSGDEQVPTWLGELADRPTVYFSLGTVFNRSKEIFQAVLDGLSELDVNVITTVGRNQDPESFGSYRDGIHIEQYIPQSLVLPHADLAITHGGSSLYASLAHGIPVVCLPMGGNQPFHAMRCVELGVGAVMSPQGRFLNFFPEPPPEITPENTRRAVADLLASDHARNEAKALGEAFCTMPDADAAVRQIEQLVATRLAVST